MTSRSAGAAEPCRGARSESLLRAGDWVLRWNAAAARAAQVDAGRA